jgi:hypothetical protein
MAALKTGYRQSSLLPTIPSNKCSEAAKLDRFWLSANCFSDPIAAVRIGGSGFD